MSLQALLAAEQARRERALRELPSSFSGSFGATSLNRLVTEGHVVTDLVYHARSVCVWACGEV